MRHLELSQDLSTANVELAEIQKKNQKILRRLKAMERDERIMERIAGESLNMGVEGGRIIRFTDQKIGAHPELADRQKLFATAE